MKRHDVILVIACLSFGFLATAGSFANTDCSALLRPHPSVMAESDWVELDHHPINYLHQTGYIEDFQELKKRHPNYLLYLTYEKLILGDRAPPQFRTEIHSGLWNLVSPQTSLNLTERLKEADFEFRGVPKDRLNKWKSSILGFLEKLDQKAALGVPPYQGYGPDYIWALILAKPFLSQTELKNYVRHAAQGMTDEVSNEDYLVGRTYPAKLFQFVKNLVLKQIKEPYQSLSDLIEVRMQNQILLKIMSVDQIDSIHPQNVAQGLILTQFKSVQIPETGKEGDILLIGKESWRISGHQFSAKYQVRLGKSLDDIAPQLESLDFKKSWADGSFTGLVFASGNMGIGEAGAHYVMNQYKQYYEQRGFSFSKPKPVRNFKEVLKAEIESGRLDYLIKEAHSEGDDRLLTTLVNEGKIVTGKRKVQGKGTEVIHIFYPSESLLQSSGRDVEFAYSEIAEWIDQRSKKAEAQLLYLDTSCFGLTSAANLLSIVENPILVSAGSSQTVDTFTNDPSTALLHVLDGLRDEKSFRQLRPYVSEKMGTGINPFQFPGDEVWNQEVRAGGIVRNANVTVELFKDGRKVSIENMFWGQK